MNMKTNFTNTQSNYKNCVRCTEGLIPISYAEDICFICIEDMKVHRFLKPFHMPEGQVLDEHLFPLSIPNNSRLTQ